MARQAYLDLPVVELAIRNRTVRVPRRCPQCGHDVTQNLIRNAYFIAWDQVPAAFGRLVDWPGPTMSKHDDCLPFAWSCGNCSETLVVLKPILLQTDAQVSALRLLEKE